jgi:hypothetical protein
MNEVHGRRCVDGFTWLTFNRSAGAGRLLDFTVTAA